MAKISDELLAASQAASNKYGVPVPVILGFAGLETGYGSTGMGKSKNNLFGIGSTAYASITESVEDFARLVTGNKDSAQSKKYGEATAKAQTNSQWVDAIREAGYNSEYADGVYENMVLNVIAKDNLNSYAGSVKVDTSLDPDQDGSSAAPDVALVWWGDIVRAVFCVLLVIAGLAFVVLALTSDKGPADAVKKIIK